MIVMLNLFQHLCAFKGILKHDSHAASHGVQDDN